MNPCLIGGPRSRLQVLGALITPDAFVAEIGTSIDPRNEIFDSQDKVTRIKALLNAYVAQAPTARAAAAPVAQPNPAFVLNPAERATEAAALSSATSGRHTFSESSGVSDAALYRPSQTAAPPTAGASAHADADADVAENAMAVIAKHPKASGGTGNWELLGQILKGYLIKQRSIIAGLTREVDTLHVRLAQERAHFNDAQQRLVFLRTQGPAILGQQAESDGVLRSVSQLLVEKQHLLCTVNEQYRITGSDDVYRTMLALETELSTATASLFWTDHLTQKHSPVLYHPAHAV